ncbi:flagellar biosynthesis GTPase FlhF [Paraburkholderia sp. MM5482-R1]
MPAQQVGEQSAEQHADAAAARADKAIHAHRLRAFAGFGEQIHDQRQRYRRDDRTAQALHGARGDQQHLRIREAAGERSEREERNAAEKQLAVSVQIAKPAAEQQAAAERQHVGVDDPHERSFAKAEIGCDGRQRDVHDGRVEHDHQYAEAEHD